MEWVTKNCPLPPTIWEERALARSKQPGRRRHVPQRTCIACHRVGDKRSLVRVVRVGKQEVHVDPTGKQSGRGAYLCAAQPCWDKALRGHLLNRALKTSLQAEDLIALETFAASLPQSLGSSLSEEANVQPPPDDR